jgi:hypothetical protein
MNADGTEAWLVREAWEVDPDHDADRPCDRCFGEGVILVVNQGEEPCGVCNGTGRHPFDIEVAVEHTGTGWIADRHRVSVIPGMVLPIVKRHPISHYSTLAEGETTRVILRSLPAPGGVVVEYTNHSGAVVDDLTLPPAAKPGMWAVKLHVHDQPVRSGT